MADNNITLPYDVNISIITMTLGSKTECFHRDEFIDFLYAEGNLSIDDKIQKAKFCSLCGEPIAK